MHLIRSVSALALAGGLTLGAATFATAEEPAEFTDAQRKAIESIVKDYLVKNPDVLQEAVAEGERRAQETQRLAQAAALKEVRDTLHNSPNGIVAGNASGDITLVEFFDYNCGYCRKAFSDVQALLKSDPKLRVVIRDFPVLGAESMEASKVGLAAKLQLTPEKMFEFHTKLLESKSRINGERALAVGKELGADVERLKRDAQGPEVKAAIAENMGLGDKLSLTGTPAFVVGEEILPGAVGVDAMRKTISDVRQCGHASC